MIDFGIYAVQRDGNGNFVVTEQLSGIRQEFGSLTEVVSFIETNLKEVCGLF